MDELGEITESESPYCYVGSNPVQRIDPDGRTWGDIINGVGTAIADNAYPGMNTAGSYPAASVSDFNAGQKIGQVASLFIGATEAVFGGGMMGGGGLSAILSGGSSAPVSVPLIAGGAIVAGQGVTMMSKATSNLMTGNGQKLEKTTTKDQGTFNNQQSSDSKSQKQSFNKAKDSNGIPKSQQPEKQYTTPDKNTGKPLKTYDYKNSKGENVTIRKDNPVKYPDGGSQGAHYNAGKTGKKLPQHHNYETH